jgi:LemA protein
VTQLILIFALLFLLTLLIGIYKSLSKLRSMSEQYWGNVQSQLDRKYDLITILTNVIKSHSAENSDAANELLEAKLKAMQSFTPFQKSLTEKSLDDSISKIFEISETYQDLIKDEKFLKIKEDINSVKKELTVSSSYYNAIIRDYNSKISSFPSSLVAKMLGHYNKETFDVDLNFQNTNKTQ